MIKFIDKLFSTNRSDHTDTIIKNTHSNDLMANRYEELKHRYNIDPFLIKLSNIVGLPVKHFEVLYETPIRLLVCRLQHIPASTTNTTPAIIVKLDQIIKGMKYRESFIMPSGVLPEEINLMKDVWRYATFYSLVLVNIGPTLTAHIVKYRIDPNEPDYLWNPFGNLIPINTPIKYIPHTPLDNASSLIFSPLIFSSATMDWLAHESSALNHAIMAILGKHGDQTLTRIIDSTLSATNPLPMTKSQVSEPTESNLLPKEPITGLDHGNLFFDWLKGGIEKENKLIMGLAMQVDTGIAFKVPMIFKCFAKQMNSHWKTIKNGFNKLKASQKLTDINGKSFTTVELSKSSHDQWLIIDSIHFNLSQPLSQHITFSDWLTFIIKFQINHAWEERPSYLITRQYIYLVVPHIFNVYSSIHTTSDEDTKSSFLSLELHIKNSDSDYFKYTLPNNETIDTLKLKRSLEFYPQL